MSNPGNYRYHDRIELHVAYIAYRDVCIPLYSIAIRINIYLYTYRKQVLLEHNEICVWGSESMAMLHRDRFERVPVSSLTMTDIQKHDLSSNDSGCFMTHHETDEGGAEGCGSLLQAKEGEPDTRDRHEEGRRRDDADHLWTEGSQHDRHDAVHEVCRKRHVVRLEETV